MQRSSRQLARALYVTIVPVAARRSRVTRVRPSCVSGARSCVDVHVDGVARRGDGDRRRDRVAEVDRVAVERRASRSATSRSRCRSIRRRARRAARRPPRPPRRDRADPDPSHRAHRLSLRSSAHSTNARSISNGSLVPSDDRLEVERHELLAQPAEPRLVARAAARAPRAARGARARCGRSRGSRDGTRRRADVREALLPDRILDDDRHDVPAARDARRATSRAGGGARKSESTNTKRARAQVAVQPAEESSTPRRGCRRARRRRAVACRSWTSHGTSRRPGGSQYGSSPSP